MSLDNVIEQSLHYIGPEALFGATTVPEALEGAANSGRGLLLTDRNLDATPMPYAELAESARKVAGALAAGGVAPGDRVAIMSSTSIPFLSCLFGVWRAGAVPVIMPLPHRLSELRSLIEEADRRLDHVAARCLVVADSFSDFIGKRVGSRRPMFTCGELTAGKAGSAGALVTRPDDFAYLQFTSGTTGASKAVALTHRQMLTNAAACWERFQILAEESVHVSWLPLYHDMGLISTLAVIARRTELVLQAPEEFLAKPDSWLEALSRYRATSTVAPNFAYALAAQNMVRRPRELDLSSLVVCGNGAEPIRMDTLEEFARAGSRHGLRREAISPMYGLAEATLAVAASSPDEEPKRDVVSRTDLESTGTARPVGPDDPDARHLAVCGHPVPGVQVRITDEAGIDVGERVVGEIRVSSPSLMHGYWNNTEATAEVLYDGWLRTGDLGYRCPDGLVVCGRSKDMIIVGGRNLFPEDYEGEAVGTEGTGEACAAFSVPGTERMVVAVEAAPRNADHESLAAAVLARLRAKLGHAPDEVLVVPRDSLPRTSSGKTRRATCKEKYFAGELTTLARTQR